SLAASGSYFVHIPKSVAIKRGGNFAFFAKFVMLFMVNFRVESAITDQSPHNSVYRAGLVQQTIQIVARFAITI
ncbi:hypothetical protein BMR10_17145, partial [Methylococcaceae bacterium CS4]